VVFEQYNQPGLRTNESGVFDAGRFKAAWTKDPDGNTIALTESRTKRPPALLRFNRRAPAGGNVQSDRSGRRPIASAGASPTPVLPARR
jgi:hypothetical protein